MIPKSIMFQDVGARNTPCPEARSQVSRLFSGRRPAPGWSCRYRGRYAPITCRAEGGRRVMTSGATDGI